MKYMLVSTKFVHTFEGEIDAAVAEAVRLEKEKQPEFGVRIEREDGSEILTVRDGWPHWYGRERYFYKLSDVPADAIEVKSGAEFLANIEGGRWWMSNPDFTCPDEGNRLGRKSDDVLSRLADSSGFTEGLEKSIDDLLANTGCRMWISKESNGGNV